MSRTFRIKNKKPLFRKMKIMTVDEVTSLVDNLSIYDFPTEQDQFDALLVKPLDEFECVHLGEEGKSCRTFELSYSIETASYDVRVFTPSTRTDWKIAINFIQTLAEHLNTKVVDEEGICYSADNISYNYENDILFGIKNLINPEYKGYTIFGINHPVSFSSDMVEKLKNADDRIQVFEDIFYENQYLDAYFAKQRFYQKDDDQQIIAAYSLTQQTETILPYEPSVEFSNLHFIKDEEISQWLITLVVFEDADDAETYSMLGELNYFDFIKRLPKNKYRHIDDKYILVDGMTKQELGNLLT
ncbi:DUF4299 family protein [Testudinibacter sp. TR-2022]|uniref:DUF4299 family protein n=1 Tax=Testudinibacter sp. TR-2022 TaxID=2585029 RepID=UPI00111BA57E|nr:DUF4299 family protein [Testudinibacter sp. TR-2022]TNH04286.1 DUF4299 family protein [Pasteurellaceae bacterium Phil31]TNH10107.1 DUF4299 family protein [Testudinibacter sp. TR-2022]TNH12491.1 DUF4299 family protein [Testudinibacter sp. TR-2022]TNH14781.1 DUF4299 family protein [Testudinibacter sp. TR-2022]TNH16282.1 DUF4299 family protein [Testudinibacter sp. TR-2022]